MIEDAKDYAASGLDIQHAMLDIVRRFPDKRTRPKGLKWGGREIHTADLILVPRTGVVRGEFLTFKADVEQGFDMEVDGWIELAAGERVKLLRTWNDPRHEPIVEYPYHSVDEKLWIWNVYKMRYPGGQVIEEKWTGNAGFWVDKVSDTERIYHCSHGMAQPPDFEACVFKITIMSKS